MNKRKKNILVVFTTAASIRASNFFPPAAGRKHNTLLRNLYKLGTAYRGQYNGLKFFSACGGLKI
jgi:hypothetical protein